jgi:hypothetical protein
MDGRSPTYAADASRGAAVGGWVGIVGRADGVGARVAAQGLVR